MRVSCAVVLTGMWWKFVLYPSIQGMDGKVQWLEILAAFHIEIAHRSNNIKGSAKEFFQLVWLDFNYTESCGVKAIYTPLIY